MTIQNNFEWLPSLPTEFNPINSDSLLHFNNNLITHTYNTNITSTNDLNDLFNPNYCEFNFDYQGLDEYLSPNKDNVSDNINLDSDDSLKNILDEIESLSSDFFLEENVSSPSDSSLSDQQIQSPFVDSNSLQVFSNFSESESPIFTESESPISSSGESVKSSENDDFSLKKVKSGRVNKKESNKVAAVRYRAKKKYRAWFAI